MNIFSFSKLDTYVRCSEMYRLQYVDRVDGIDTSSIETDIGSRCHNALERFYLDSSVPNPYVALLEDWKAELEKDGLGSLYTDLNHLASDVSKLMLRASASYSGPDAIRTGKREVSKSPEMTADWKNAARELRLQERQSRIDQLASKVQPDKWSKMSLADSFSHSCSILFGYKNPKEIAEILLVEMPLSDVKYAAANPDNPSEKLLASCGNPIPTSRRGGEYKVWKDPETNKSEVLTIDNKVVFPKLDPETRDFIKDPKTGEIEYIHDDVIFNGYIDLVCRTSNGKLAIIDHKTSKELPTMQKVARHQQLLLYGWAVWRLTGEKPDYIGINHLRSNKLVMAHFDLDLALEVLKTKLHTINGIDNKVFIKQDPFGYGNKCQTETAKGIRYCPFFSTCHKNLMLESY